MVRHRTRPSDDKSGVIFPTVLSRSLSCPPLPPLRCLEPQVFSTFPSPSWGAFVSPHATPHPLASLSWGRGLTHSLLLQAEAPHSACTHAASCFSQPLSSSPRPRGPELARRGHNQRGGLRSVEAGRFHQAQDQRGPQGTLRPKGTHARDPNQCLRQ